MYSEKKDNGLEPDRVGRIARIAAEKSGRDAKQRPAASDENIIPVYDNGGEVAGGNALQNSPFFKTLFGNKLAPAPATPPASQPTVTTTTPGSVGTWVPPQQHVYGQPQQPAAPVAPPPAPPNVYNTRPGTPRRETNPLAPSGAPQGNEQPQYGYSPIPLFDEGGDVDVNDGKHQLAIVQDGERVLTPEENEQYKKEHPEVVKSTDAASATNGESSHGVLRSDANAEPLISTDEEKSSQEKPTQGHVLGQEWLKRMGVKPVEPTTSDVAGKIEERPAAALPKIEMPREMHQETAGGPLIPGAPSTETPNEQRDLRNMERKAQVARLEQQRQDALKAGDLTTADKLAVAKAELQKTPWSDRSTLSKFGKIASVVGNIAGDVVSPNIMALIPGTDLNRQLKQRAAFNRITPESEVDLRQAQTAAAGAKEPTPAAQVYDWAIKQGKSPEEALAMSQGVGKTPEEKFTDWALKGNNGKPQLNESGQPYTQLTAHQAWLSQAPDKGTDKPLGAAVPNVNKALTDRYQVLHPGKPLPAEFTLGNVATAADFERVDKLMEQTEKATATSTQQKQIEADKKRAADESKRRFEQAASRKDIARHDSDYVKPAEATETSYAKMQHAFDEFEVARSQSKELPTGAQSMLALSTHLATTFGGVKGSRITKDMIQEHLGARGVTDRALAAIQRLTNGDVLSPDQWAAFHELISSTRDIAWQTAVREADRKHIPMDFLPDGLTAVKVEGHKAGIIHSEKLTEFQKKYPDAEVLSGEKE